MLVLITYDVSTETNAGKKRLNKVAKYCLKYGQRVQNSVFECSLNSAQFRIVVNDLENMISEDEDSIRFYNLGDHYQSKITHIGIKESYDPNGLLLV